jgi:hypothetical protein
MSEGGVNASGGAAAVVSAASDPPQPAAASMAMAAANSPARRVNDIQVPIMVWPARNCSRPSMGRIFRECFEPRAALYPLRRRSLMDSRGCGTRATGVGAAEKSAPTRR